MSRHIICVLLLFVMMLSGCVTANSKIDNATIDNATARLKANYPEFASVEVTESAVKPLYEFKYNGKVLYTTDGDHVIIGLIYDKDRKLVTPIYQPSFAPDDTPSSTPAAKVDLSFLDLSKAVKIGNGKHTVIEFTDVECPYCKRAEMFFPATADVTRYIYFIALDFHPGAKPKAIHILCSGGNAAAEYEKVMLGENINVTTCPEGEELFALHTEYSKRLNLSGTPMFFIDGVLVEGANPVILEMIK